jgi:hypothetical protein
MGCATLPALHAAPHVPDALGTAHGPWTLAHLAGHRDMAITKRYVHPQADMIRAAMDRARVRVPIKPEPVTRPATAFVVHPPRDGPNIFRAVHGQIRTTLTNVPSRSNTARFIKPTFPDEGPRLAWLPVASAWRIAGLEAAKRGTIRSDLRMLPAPRQAWPACCRKRLPSWCPSGHT